MAPFSQFLPPSVTRPVHMTLAEPHSGLRSLARVIEDQYYSKPSHRYHEDVLSPSFDVRESDSAFFLEGEFPGVGRKEDITIEKLGPRTLLVESNLTRFNIDAEWGKAVLVSPGTIQSEMAEQQPHAMSDQGMIMERDEKETNKQNSSSAERKEERGNEDGLGVRLAERHVGYLQRSFTFPCAVEIEALKARLRCGLLVMMVPKMMGAKIDSKTINIDD
jgi:HSP20 family protein